MIRASDGNICIRYIKNPVTDRPFFADQLFQITRRAPVVAAGVMSATITLSSVAYGQAEIPAYQQLSPFALASVQNKYAKDEESDQQSTPETVGASVEGYVWDANGKPVADVQLILVTEGELYDEASATSGEDGRYKFEDLEAGTYVLRIRSDTGVMKKALPTFTVADGQQKVENLHVIIAPPKTGDGHGEGVGVGYGFGGAMVMIDYSLPLSRAVADDNIDTVRELLAKGARVNDRDKNYSGISPLFLAVENGNIDIVRLLIEHGADVNLTDDTKRTPLMSIDSDATPELVELLMRSGAKINARDDDETTALLFAISYLEPETLAVLIHWGADVNLADKDGTTALLKAADDEIFDSVKALILAGADVNKKDRNGETAWQITSSTKIEDLLVEYGATIDYGPVTISARD